MSVITFQCYACNMVLQVGAEYAGRKAKCSQCGTSLTVPALTAEPSPAFQAAPPAATIPEAPKPPPLPPPVRAGEAVEPVDEPRRRRAYAEDDEPLRRRRSSARDELLLSRRAGPPWQRVQLGFLLVFIALCVMTGTFGLLFLGRLVGLASLTGLLILMRIGLILHFMGTIPAIVGYVFWLFVPTNRAGVFGFAIASLAVAGMYLLFQLVSVGQSFGAFFGASTVLILLMNLLQAAHFMMNAFFVRGVARCLDDPVIEKSALVNVILSGCLAGYRLLTGVILLAMAPTIFDVGRGFAITSQILYILGDALALVVYVFTILAVARCKRLVEECLRDEEAPRA